MPLTPLLILGQVFTLAVGDRTEVRAVFERDDSRMEADTQGIIAMSLRGRSAGLHLSYAPGLLLAPLQLPQHNATFTQTLAASADLTLRSRRTSIRFEQEGSLTQDNFRSRLLSGPGTTTATGQPDGQGQTGTPGPVGGSTGTPGTGTTGTTTTAPTLLSGTTKVGQLTSQISVSHQLSRPSSLGGEAHYKLSEGLDEESRAVFPLTATRGGSLFLANRLSRRDQLVTSANGEYVTNTRDDWGWLASALLGLRHAFSARSAGQIAAGVAVTRARPEQDATATTGIGPVALLSYGYAAPLAGGAFSFVGAVGYSPVIDATTAAPDSRISLSLEAGWNDRARFSAYASATSALSVNPDDAGGLSTVATALGISYALGSGFSFDTGVRTAWQSFEGTELVHPTAVVFAALTWRAPLHP